MPLIMKRITILLLLLSTISFSQNLSTKFIRSGKLIDSPSINSKSICDFKKGKVVDIIEYFGITDAKNMNAIWWKVKYGKYIGYVTSPFLLLTDDINKFQKESELKVIDERKRKKDSIIKMKLLIEKRKDSIEESKRIAELNEIKRIDSIKPNILEYAADSLLTFTARSGASIKVHPEPSSKIIESFYYETKVVVLDYVNNYFKVCADNKCGYLSEIFWRKKINSKTENELVSEFINIKTREESEKNHTEEEDRLLTAKDTYFNKCSYSQNEKDEFSGVTRKNTKFYYLDNYSYGYLSIQLRRYGNSKVVIIKSAHDLGCTSPYSNNRSTVKFKLENGDIVTFYHFSDIECGDFELWGKLTTKDIYRLKKSPIKTVRLSGTEYYHDFKDLLFKDFFIKKLDCIK